MFDVIVKVEFFLFIDYVLKIVCDFFKVMEKGSNKIFFLKSIIWDIIIVLFF